MGRLEGSFILFIVMISFSRFYLPIPVKDIEIIVKDVKRANRLAITRALCYNLH